MRSPSAAFRLRRRGWRPRQPEPPLPKGGCPSAHTGAGGYVFPASPPSGGESLRRHLRLRKKPLDGSAPGRLRIRPKHVLRFACAAGTSGRPSPTRGEEAASAPQGEGSESAVSLPYGAGVSPSHRRKLRRQPPLGKGAIAACQGWQLLR